MKKVSFIIPVYNCEQFLEACVASIRTASLDHYEIILVDDGSQDRSGQICDALASEAQDIRCVHQENQGVSAARNRGLQLACGDYIVFVDADDSIEPLKLAGILRAVDRDDSIDLAIFGMSFDYYYRGKCYRRDALCYPEEGTMEPEQWQQVFDVLFTNNSLSPIWNKVFKKQILDDYHLRLHEDMFLYEDLEFVIRYMAHCQVIYNSPELVYHYRQAEDEGNAGRRLKRIDHLPDLVDQIEYAVEYMITEQEFVSTETLKIILPDLYFMLARTKIHVSTVAEINTICDDYLKWGNSHSAICKMSESKFSNQLEHKKILALIAHRFYITVRHKAAVLIKGHSRKLKWC